MQATLGDGRGPRRSLVHSAKVTIEWGDFIILTTCITNRTLSSLYPFTFKTYASRTFVLQEQTDWSGAHKAEAGKLDKHTVDA